MTETFDRRRLFWLSVLALFTAAMNTSLRAATAAGIKAQWIDPVAPADAGRLIGEALGASFLGFAITLFLTSALLDVIGAKRMLLASGACFIIGTVTILLAGSLASGAGVHRIVWLGMLICGMGWGLTESAVNPLTAQLYPEDMTHRLNILHAWWPAGLIVGGLAGYCLSAALSWQAILASTVIPAALVIVVAFGTTFPPPMRSESGVTFGEMMTEVIRRPSFLVWFGAMFLTAASELAPGQWVDVALTHKVGMRGILLLVYVSALMFVLRHFGGRLARLLTNPGLLWVSSLLAAGGLFMLSRASSPSSALLAATVWGAGVCVMWPTMLASVAERYPRGGSWMIALVGSAGALSIYFVLPQLGSVYDAAKIQLAGGAGALAALHGPALAAVESGAAARSFEYVAILPLILLFVFGAYWLFDRRTRTASVSTGATERK